MPSIPPERSPNISSILIDFPVLDLAQCHEWGLATSADGYGQICVGGKTLYVHRLVFEEATGRPPQGVVRHTCDNPPCFNPAHLIDGTQKQNIHDSLRRGRQPASKLTWEIVAEIRSRRNEIPQRALAEAYGVSQRLIGRVLRNESWPEEAAP